MFESHIASVASRLEQLNPALYPGASINPRAPELALPIRIPVPAGLVVRPGENVDVILGGTQPPRLSPNQRSPGPDRSTRSGDLGLLLPGLTSLAAPMPALLPPHGASLSQPGGPATPVDMQAIVANLVSCLAQQQPVFTSAHGS